MKHIFIAFFFLISLNSFGQQLENNWKFSSIKKQSSDEIVSIDSSDIFSLNDGKFTFKLKQNSDSVFSGNYIRQHNLLILNFNKPKDTVRYFTIVSLDSLQLVLTENDTNYKLSSFIGSQKNVSVHFGQPVVNLPKILRDWCK